MYVDHTRPPFIDIRLPSAIVVPVYFLIVLYSVILAADFHLFRLEHRLRHIVSSKQLRLFIITYHILIPMIFVSSYQPYNLLFAAVPWFIAVYTASMPREKLTINNWVHELINITIDKQKQKQQPGLETSIKFASKTHIRLRGLQKVALGIFKLALMHVILDPLLPTYGSDALEYPWLHPLSLVYTLLFGIKAYCFLGAIDIFMGSEQALFAWDMVDLFNSPILSASPRDFWSRRWNRVIRNLLHEHVFTVDNFVNFKEAETDADPVAQRVESDTVSTIKKGKSNKRTRKPRAATTTARTTRSASKRAAKGSVGSDLTNQSSEESHVEQQIKKMVPTEDVATQQCASNSDVASAHVASFWNTRRMRGLLSFAISGVFHELIIMSTCRHITLENFMFFMLQGIAVMLELDASPMLSFVKPKHKSRIPRILLHLLFMAVTGRLFTGPFLRYNFFAPNFSYIKRVL